MSERQIGIRLDPGLRAKVMERIGKNKKYHKITDFIIAAIEEKLDPELRKIRERETFNELIDDPEKIRVLKERLGLN